MVEQPHPPDLTETAPHLAAPQKIAAPHIAAPVAATPPSADAAETRLQRPQTSRKPTADLSLWRFSIRELLLLTAAVAAFLAWAGLFYQRSKPYQRTKVPDEIGRLEVLHSISRSLGHQASSSTSSGGGSGDMHSTTRDFDYSLDLPRSLRGTFMEAYREHVIEILDKHSDSFSASGTIRDEFGLRGFQFDYSQGTTTGSLFVRSLRTQDELTLFIYLHENDSRRP